MRLINPHKIHSLDPNNNPNNTKMHTTQDESWCTFGDGGFDIDEDPHPIHHPSMPNNNGSDGFGDVVINENYYPKKQLSKAYEEQISDYETVKYKLIELYSEHAPHKIKNVDKMLFKYAGQEHQMLKAALAKYGVVPSTSDISTKSAPEFLDDRWDNGENSPLSLRRKQRRGSARDLSTKSAPEFSDDRWDNVNSGDASPLSSRRKQRCASVATTRRPESRSGSSGVPRVMSRRSTTGGHSGRTSSMSNSANPSRSGRRGSTDYYLTSKRVQQRRESSTGTPIPPKVSSRRGPVDTSNHSSKGKSSSETDLMRAQRRSSRRGSSGTGDLVSPRPSSRRGSLECSNHSSKGKSRSDHLDAATRAQRRSSKRGSASGTTGDLVRPSSSRRGSLECSNHSSKGIKPRSDTDFMRAQRRSSRRGSLGVDELATPRPSSSRVGGSLTKSDSDLMKTQRISSRRGSAIAINTSERDSSPRGGDTPKTMTRSGSGKSLNLSWEQRLGSQGTPKMRLGGSTKCLTESWEVQVGSVDNDFPLEKVTLRF